MPTPFFIAGDFDALPTEPMLKPLRMLLGSIELAGLGANPLFFGFLLLNVSS